MPVGKSRFVIVVTALATLAILVPLAAWLTLRASLPQLDGELRMTPLAAPTTVERDVLGSVTVRAQNRQDISFALGFVHAQERFFEMDLMRRSPAGELAELFGPLALPADRSARMHRARARSIAELAKVTDPQRAQIEAYTDGVNAGLAALPVRAFPYLLTRTTPRAWRGEDTLLVVWAMAFTLNDADDKRELGLSRLHAALPESAYRFLTAPGGAWDAPISGPRFDWPEPPDATELDLRNISTRNQPREGAAAEPPNQAGSNSFAVSGSAAGGAALVADDMHLDLRVPNIWFRARLVYPDPLQPSRNVDISGASLPGTPAIVVGSNRNIAWGFTNSEIDTTDWVRVITAPDDPTRYRTAEGSEAAQIHDEIIHVRGASDAHLQVRETRWGPILAKDVDGTELALAWITQQPGAIDLQLQLLETAHNVDEAVAIAQQSGIPAQNFLVGDRAGNIAWTIAGRIPRRIGDYDPTLPADWSIPGTGWDGWLDPAQYPLIANPPDQQLWTANQRITEDPWLARIGDGGYDLGARAGQIRDDLRVPRKASATGEPAPFTPADMLAIQLDDRALFLEHWKDLLSLELKRMDPSPMRDKLQKAMGDWSGAASIDSVAYRLVRAWRLEVIDRVLAGFTAAVRERFPDFSMPHLSQAENAVWKLIVERPLNLLPAEYTDWDALLIDCAARVGERLEKQPGGIAARTWGERNTTRIDHPMARALPPFIGRWLNMPAQMLPGDSNMPHVQAPAFGASERFAVSPGDEEHGYFMMPGGQSGHPLSPYYGAGHADWAEGKPTPFLPGPAQHTLRLLPTTAIAP